MTGRRSRCGSTRSRQLRQPAPADCPLLMWRCWVVCAVRTRETRPRLAKTVEPPPALETVPLLFGLDVPWNPYEGEQCGIGTAPSAVTATGSVCSSSSCFPLSPCHRNHESVLNLILVEISLTKEYSPYNCHRFSYG